MASFLSNIENRVDAKGRVSVPAMFREELEDRASLVVFPSPRGNFINCHTADNFDAICRKWRQQDLEEGNYNKVVLGPPAGHEDPVELVMDVCSLLVLDSEGRITLPQDLLEHAQIERRATFSGRWDHFQIWASEAHQKRRAANMDMLRAAPGSAAP